MAPIFSTKLVSAENGAHNDEADAFQDHRRQFYEEFSKLRAEHPDMPLVNTSGGRRRLTRLVVQSLRSKKLLISFTSFDKKIYNCNLVKQSEDKSDGRKCEEKKTKNFLD